MKHYKYSVNRSRNIQLSIINTPSFTLFKKKPYGKRKGDPSKYMVKRNYKGTKAKKIFHFENNEEERERKREDMNFGQIQSILRE